MSKGTCAVLVTMAAMLTAACGSSGGGGAAADEGGSVRLHARRAKFQPIYQSKRGSRPGDAFIATSTLDGGGHKEAYCVFSPRRRTTWCAVTLVLPQGQVTAEGVFTDAPRSSGTIALLSGAGEYAGARGTLETSGVAGRDESITLTLL